MKNHQKIITHAVAQWLEEMHYMTADSNGLMKHAAGDVTNDLETYKVLFDHLRGGKL